jgi:transcriptional regulator with XRE-family HTH domain
VDSLKALGERIKRVRTKSALTQSEFGARLDVSKSSVINYETAKRIPDALFLLRIIMRFNVDPQWLMMGSIELTGKKSNDIKNRFSLELPEEYVQLIRDLDIPVIRYGIMAEYARLKEVYKPVLEQYKQDRDSKHESMEG